MNEEEVRKFIAKDVNCEVCGKRKAIKTDGESRQVCHHCAAGLPEPFKNPPRQRRNEKCACNSNKKFKNCCLREANEIYNIESKNNS